MIPTDYSSTHAELPRHPEELVRLGRAALANGGVDQALRCFQAVLTIDQVQALTELAVLAHSPEAPTAMQKCVAYMGLGYLARQQGERTVALAHFDAARASDRSHVPAWLEAAIELRELGRLHQAEALYRQILLEIPTESSALIGLGQIARQRGNREGVNRRAKRTPISG
jgi:tetratricopeptide (TPR) repeat protein